MNFLKVIIGAVAALFVAMPTVAGAYPSLGSEPSEGCPLCHTSEDHKKNLVVKLLRVKDGKEVVNDYNADRNMITIPLTPGGKVGYKLVLGTKEAGKANAVGWLWKLPAGIETELPNCIRKLEQGQPFTKYQDVDGDKNVQNHTVAGQTFFFGNVRTDKPVTGELLVTLGNDNKGPEALTGHSIKIIFVSPKK